jgi:hypothetical protein
MDNRDNKPRSYEEWEALAEARYGVRRTLSSVCYDPVGP